MLEHHTICLKYYYIIIRSPEQINECKYNEKSDIWSTGCLLYEIAALKPPFEATNHLSLGTNLIKIKGRWPDIFIYTGKSIKIERLFTWDFLSINVEKSLKIEIFSHEIILILINVEKYNSLQFLLIIINFYRNLSIFIDFYL